MFFQLCRSGSWESSSDKSGRLEIWARATWRCVPKAQTWGESLGRNSGNQREKNSASLDNQFSGTWCHCWVGLFPPWTCPSIEPAFLFWSLPLFIVTRNSCSIVLFGSSFLSTSASLCLPFLSLLSFLYFWSWFQWGWLLAASLFLLPSCLRTGPHWNHSPVSCWLPVLIPCSPCLWKWRLWGSGSLLRRTSLVPSVLAVWVAVLTPDLQRQKVTIHRWTESQPVHKASGNASAFPLGLLPSSRHWVGVTLTTLPPAKHFSLPLLDYYYCYYK